MNKSKYWRQLLQESIEIITQKYQDNHVKALKKSGESLEKLSRIDRSTCS